MVQGRKCMRRDVLRVHFQGKKGGRKERGRVEEGGRERRREEEGEGMKEERRRES